MGDTDFPAVMGNWGEARDKATLWRSNYSGKEEYSQFGTDSPEEGYERQYSGREGSDIDPYFRERVKYK
tara:strand:+ start:540 stop:746 length:207 start_codon:yes stop_codon:yes gene_type:complete